MDGGGKSKQRRAAVIWLLVVVGLSGFFATFLYRSVTRNPPKATANGLVPQDHNEGAGHANVLMEHVTSLLSVFATDLREAHPDRAYALMAPGYQMGVTKDRFAAAARAKGWLTTGTAVSVRTLSLRDGTVQVTGVWRSELGNVNLDAHFTEIQEGGRTTWKLVSLNLGGAPALAAPGR